MAAMSDAELKEHLLAELRKAGSSTIPAHVDVIVAAANAKAQDDIKAALVARGYLLATALQWDSFWKFNHDIGLYYCGQSHLAQFTVAEGQHLKAHDRRAELSTAPFTVGYELIEPDADEEEGTTSVRQGKMSTACNYFQPPKRPYR